VKKIQLRSQEDPSVRAKTFLDSHSTHIRKKTHHREYTCGPNDKTKTNNCKGVDRRTYTALMPTTVLSTDQRSTERTTGCPWSDRGGV